MLRGTVCVIAALLMSVVCHAQETIVIAGAGPSTSVVDLFFRNFSGRPEAKGYEFIVPPESIKHAGGVKHSFKALFGRTGRPLNATELGYKRKEIFLAMMPISFATGRDVKLPVISIGDLERVFRKEITNWKKLGGPDAEIVTVGRESSEALFSELKRYYTFFRRVDFDKVYERDHEVVEFLDSPQGHYAISFGAKSNLGSLNEVVIKEELKTGVRLGLVYDEKNENHPLVLAVKEYAQSDEWRAILKPSGAYPLD